MRIEPKKVTIRELVDRYSNNNEEGVVGYGEKLNIRPKYQREFVYKDGKRDEVIRTVRKNFPLSLIYWVKNENDTYEVLDGQQRIISICDYIGKSAAGGSYAVDFKYFHNLEKEEKNQILDYELMVYICSGGDREKLDWFKTINIAGEPLTTQELRNAVYTGEWLTDAKSKFSKTNCPASVLPKAKDYLSGSPIRQEWLEEVLNWISGGNIEDYMSKHQHDKNANDLWDYFEKVISWVNKNFKTYNKPMKGLPWGRYYNDHKDKPLDPDEVDERVKALLLDPEIGRYKGIWEYILTGEQKCLELRCFGDVEKRIAFDKQQGICIKCQKQFKIEEMHGDHIIPWSKGGKTEQGNCQMLCKKCNGQKSNT